MANVVGITSGRLPASEGGSLEGRQRLPLVAGGSGTAPLGSLTQTTTLPSYRDAWPSVEVTVGVREIFQLDLQEGQFGADFTVYLDWVDPKLRHNVHYHYNVEKRQFELSRLLAASEDPMAFFNPEISVANARNLAYMAEGSDDVPFIKESEAPDSGSRSEDDQVPWLTKRFHFRGPLRSQHINAQYFPFDLEQLEIRLECCDLAGETSLRQKRRVQAREPTLRKEGKAELLASRGDVSRPMSVVYRNQARELELNDIGSRSEWCIVRHKGETMSHKWKTNANPKTAFQIGEMELVGFGGAVGGPSKSSQYKLAILLRRQYHRYLVDFAIQTLQVVVACSSFFVPMNDDMLQNRMGITLTVLLTIVASTTSRPAAIEALPYGTLHDYYEQIMLLCVVGIAFENLAVFTVCWGSFRDDGVHDRWDAALHMIVNDPKSNSSYCGHGITGATVVDDHSFVFMMSLLLVVLLMVAVASQNKRIAVLAKVKFKLDSKDVAPQEHSKFVIVSKGYLRLLLRNDDLECIRPVALLPGLWLFMKIWRCVYKITTGFAGCRGRCCGEGRCCGDRSGGSLPRSASKAFHPVRAKEILAESTLAMQELQNIQVPRISQFAEAISPYDTLRILDIGSGEIGFYVYWRDRDTDRLHMDSRGKQKYEQGQIFATQFLAAGATGEKQLADLIVSRFGLQKQMRTVTERTSAHSSGDSVGGPANTTPASSQPLRSVGALNFFQLPGSAAPDSSSEPSQQQQQQQVPMQSILLGFTGLNREQIIADPAVDEQLHHFCTELSNLLKEYHLTFRPFVPLGKAEAGYELKASKWLVQYGDLDVTQEIKLDAAFRYLQGERATLAEVLAAYVDFKAEEELELEFLAVAGSEAAVASALEKSSGPLPGLGADALGELGMERNLSSSVTTIRDPEPHSPHGPPHISTSTGGSNNEVTVSCEAFYKNFERNHALLRALTRQKLFAGTISAGGGSCQVTLRCLSSTESSQVYSVPLGNKTPLTELTPAKVKKHNLHDERYPNTRRAWGHLMQPASAKGGSNAELLWNEERVVRWQIVIERCLQEYAIPRRQRGLFLGVSAVYYAAHEARCAEKLMERKDLTDALYARREELLESGAPDEFVLVNLTLVHSLLEHALHPKALIVCKRNWNVGPDHEEFVATWTLGFFLRHTQPLDSLEQVFQPTVTAHQLVAAESSRSNIPSASPSKHSLTYP